MTYNPIKGKFYEQVTITAYLGSGESPNIRNKPESILPDGVTIILGLGSGCGDFGWEEVIDYDKFREAISK